MYNMFNSKDSDKKMVRAKGASRQCHEHMTTDHFDQAMDKDTYANRYKIAPTVGHDVSIRFESRKMISAFNTKRRCEVRKKSMLA